VEAALQANRSGLGRTGVDFWPVLPKGTKGTSDAHGQCLNARYLESDWAQLNMCKGTDALLHPGPEGAVSTARFEMLREGIQECEARIFIERSLLDSAGRKTDDPERLDEALVKKCQESLDGRTWFLFTACLRGAPTWSWYEGSGWEGRAAGLFALAGDVAGALEKTRPTVK
jgi:hypothetical protein